MEDYTDFDTKIGNLIAEMSKRKDSWNVKKAFKAIELKDFEQILNEL